ncbi:MAG TPA: ribonuclease III [Usitatibacteraceae bacterium]
MDTRQALQHKLGHQFAQQALLEQALTHRSFGVPHNERLEFLGDSVLNCAVARLIFNRYEAMPEGDLSRLRANLVNQVVLAEVAATLALGALLRLGEGELKTGGSTRPSILADAVEALLGAVFLDAGFDRAQAVIESLFSARIDNLSREAPAKDAKTTLQEWLQARRLSLPRYTVLKIDGEAHRQIFFVRCEVESERISATGTGPSRRAAEQDAAAQAYALLAGVSKHD